MSGVLGACIEGSRAKRTKAFPTWATVAPRPLGRWHPLLVSVFSALFCVLALLSHARADELEYSAIDRATVRVFSLKGVGIEREEVEGRTIPLAVPDAGHGSGVLVDGQGLVLTAKHVVEGATMVAVQLPGAKSAVAARVVHVDPKHDVAWVAIDGEQPNFVTLPEEPEKLAVRSSIFVVGYPLDAARSDPQSQRGVISGTLPDGSLQLGVALNPGNSGGPVITESETLVGIAVARADPMRGAQGIGVAVPVSLVLPSYVEVTQRGALEKTRALLQQNARGDLVRASALSSLMTSQGMADALRLSDTPEGEEGKRFWTQLKQAIAAVGEESPELYLLAASRHFNNAVWRKQAGTSAWVSAMKTASRLVEQAVKYDRNLAKNDFVQLVRRVSRNTGEAPASTLSDTGYGDASGDSEEADDLDPELDIEVADGLPTFAAGPTFTGGIGPFLVRGGVSGWLYLGRAVNIAFRYEYGVAFVGLYSETSHYGELFAGLVLANWRGTTTANLAVDIEHGFGFTKISYLTRRLPTESAVVLEGGAIVSGLSYHYCDEVCQEDSLLGTTAVSVYTTHTTTLAAGFRYRYFYHAGGASLARNSRQVLDLSAHLLAFDFAAPPSEDAYNADDDEPLTPTPVGFRAGFTGSLAFWSSILFELAGGLLPATGDPFLTFGATYYIY